MNKFDYKDSLYYGLNYSSGDLRNFYHRVASKAYRKRRLKNISKKSEYIRTEIALPQWIVDLKGTSVGDVNVDHLVDTIIIFDFVTDEGLELKIWCEEGLDKSMNKFIHSDSMPEIENESDELLMEILKR